MDGQIDVISEPGQGAIFWFAIALEKMHQSTVLQPGGAGQFQKENLNTRPKEKTEAVAKTVKILLAEDNPINQKVATLILRKSGYEVKVVNDGAQAV